MKGRAYRHTRGYWFISWYQDGKVHKIYDFMGQKGIKMWEKRQADMTLSHMRADVVKGIFRIEKYKCSSPSDVSQYLDNWFDVEKEHLAPSTVKSYEGIIKNHLKPWFEKNRIDLHDIQYDTLCRLLNDLEVGSKTRNNIMYCLRSCLGHAKKSNRILSLPVFPEQQRYNMVTPIIDYISEERQIKIIRAIPEQHQPIFWWLKYHLRRPCEGMALHRCDYIKEEDKFIIRRSISNHTLIERTKTKYEDEIPCHPDFHPIMRKMVVRMDSPFFFTHPDGYLKEKRYTHNYLWKLWKDGCEKVGENVTMYVGLKHSSCSQYVNEKGLSVDDVQTLTGHKKREMVLRYTKVSLERKRQLMVFKRQPTDDPQEGSNRK